MSCKVVNSQASLGTQLPPLPATIPTTQAGWQQFLTALQQWGTILKQEQNAPNVLPTMFQTFATASATLPLASLTAVGCTPTVDNTEQYYGNASLKVAVASSGATLAFTGFPVAIESASKWYCAFQILAPAGLTGSLTVATSGGTIKTEAFTIPSSANWQQVWGLFDFSADSTPTATWEFTFTTITNVWIDGMQMSVIGDTIINLPAFSSSQMVAGGPLAYVTNLDGIPDGTTYARTLGAYLQSGVPFTYRGVWASSAGYNIGDEVLSGGNYYLAIAPGTNNVPPNVTYWILIGPQNLDNVANGSTYSKLLAAYVALGVAYNYQGAYNNSTAYPQGAEVSSGGNYYLAVAATTGNAPPNVSYWQLLGPTTIDNIPDGTTYGRFLNSGMTGNIANTNGLVANAASQIISATSASAGSGTLIGTSQSVDLLTASGTFTGAPVGIDFSGMVEPIAHGATFNSPLQIYITRDGTPIGVAYVDAYSYTTSVASLGSPTEFWIMQATLTIDDTPPAGSHTYAVHFNGAAATGTGPTAVVNVTNMTLKVREYKK